MPLASTEFGGSQVIFTVFNVALRNEILVGGPDGAI